MNPDELKLRQDMCEVSNRLYQAGFMAGSDGNISTILNKNEILITPSRLCKGYMEPHQMVKVDMQGNQISGDLPPTSETPMHLAAYEERPDICSVVHCHPPMLVAFTVAGLKLPGRVLPEVEVIFGGEIPVAPYATPGGTDVANSIRQFIRNPANSVVLLDHHGIIGVGNDIFQAAMKIEHAEAAAKVIYYARQLGGERTLPPDSVEHLKAVNQKITELESRVFTGYCRSDQCDSSVGSTHSQSNVISDQELENIVRTIISKLGAERR